MESEIDKSTEIDSLIKKVNTKIRQLQEAIFEGVEKKILIPKSK